MGLLLRQDAQLGTTLDSIIGFVDSTPPAATMESGASHIADDLNNIRSMLSYFNDLQAGNWYDPLTAPSLFPTEGAIRGIQAVADDLHALERKRFLFKALSLAAVTVTAAQNWEVLGVGEIPPNTTAAVGAVTTRGTVVATHAGAFGTSHSLDEVAGPTAISPENLVLVVDATTRDPITSAGRTVYGLLQGEATLTDGGTITPSGGAGDVQVSFVRLDAAGTDLEACPVGDIAGATVSLCFRERGALEDLPAGALINDTKVDVPAGSTVTRQVAYDNQGATLVTILTNALLQLGGPGLFWEIQDDGGDDMLRITEGDAGGTGVFLIGTGADTFDVDAAVNDFLAGVTVRSGGARPIDIGVVDGVIESTAGDLELQAAAELVFDDSYRGASTFSVPIPLADSTAEWDAYEAAMGGELSLLAGITRALRKVRRTRVDSTVSGGNIPASTDVNGPGTPHNNVTVDLLPYDQAGIASLEVFFNGELLLTSLYSAGGTPSEGDLQFTFVLKGVGVADDLTVIRNGDNIA